MSRTDAQHKAIVAARKMLCVDAGAGSGKTLVLVERIVELIATRQADLDAIVAITFTDKAASEMKARLRRAFREKAPISDAGEMTRWRELERRVETARIGTIHSFCASLLREHALRIGADPDFSVLTEAEAALLRDETVTEAVHARLEAAAPGTMRAAVEYGPATLIRELNALLAKRGMLERLETRLPLSDPEALAAHWYGIARDAHERRLAAFARSRHVRLWREDLAAFDGLCDAPSDGREVQRLLILEELERLSGAADTAAVEASVARIAASSAGRPLSKNWGGKETFEAIKNLVEEIKKHAEQLLWAEPDPAIEARAARLTCDLFGLLGAVRDAYAAAKAARSTMDFDDLITAAWGMLRDNDTVRARTARGIRFLLIDEFQDTDWIQLDIARMLAEEPNGPDWFFVGDAKQSIYDFRGAEVEVFQEQHGKADEAIPLARNFRTVPEIIDFVNDVFARTGLLEAVEPEYHAMESDRPRANGARIAFLVPRESGDKTNAETNRRSEADLIAWRIDEMCAGPNRVAVGTPDGTRPAGYGDVAILLRSFSCVHLYEEGLRRRSIPFRVVAGVGFYERQEILDLRNILGVLVNPWDEIALLGFLRGPLGGLPDGTLAAMRRAGGVARTFWADTDSVETEEMETLRRARALIDDLRRHQDLPLPVFMRYVLDATKFESILLDHYLGVQKAWNVRKAADLAADFARTQPARLPAFMHYLEQLAGQEVREGDASVQHEGAVTLMTIHKAKGLEFPIVVLADTGRELDDTRSGILAVHRDLGAAARITGDDGEPAKPCVYTAIRQACRDKETAEHARVLYVGMTRARDWLLFGGPPIPGKNSWLDTLHRAYRILDREHGESFEAGNWSAVVFHDTVPPFHRPGATPAREPVDVASLVARAEPIAVSSAGRAVISVSALLDAMDSAHDSEDEPRALLDTPASIAAMTRGTLVHRLFECWRPGQAMDIHAFLARECPALNLRETLAADLAGLLRRFEAGVLAHRMAAARRIERETPFCLRVGDTLVSGTVDALVDRTLLLDYKTGHPHPERQARYEWQLRLYAAAIESLLGAAPSEALLYYAGPGETQAVDIAPPLRREALERAAAAIRAMKA